MQQEIATLSILEGILNSKVMVSEAIDREKFKITILFGKIYEIY